MKVISRVLYFSLVFTLFSITPIFAAGSLNVTSGSLSSFSSAGDFWNTGLNVVLNISLNATVGEINNITSILLNFTGTANVSNITAVLMYNDTNSNAIIDPSEALLGSNTSLNISRNFTIVPFTVNFTMNHTKRNILIAFNISRGAFRFNTTGAVIASNASIVTSNPDSLDNITISSGSINSSAKQILDMHANATLSPRIVDTNVSEQIIVYTITPTGTEKINRTKIVIPVGYSVVEVTEVSIGGTPKNRSFDGTPGGGPGSDGVGITLNVTEFNVTTVAAGVSQQININFTVNTNVTAKSSAAFTSKVFSNISFIDTDILSEETNVTTQQVIQILSVGGNKTAALINGTDYWEFTFRLNFTANVSGLIQFRMNNWTNSQANISLTNQTPPSTNNTQFYANLRMSNDTTRQMNVTDNYNITSGISFNVTADSATENTVTKVKHLVLRMTVPSTVPVSSNWWTVYSMLVRSRPT